MRICWEEGLEKRSLGRNIPDISDKQQEQNEGFIGEDWVAEDWVGRNIVCQVIQGIVYRCKDLGFLLE